MKARVERKEDLKEDKGKRLSPPSTPRPGSGKQGMAGGSVPRSNIRESLQRDHYKSGSVRQETVAGHLPLLGNEVFYTCRKGALVR